jgi:hypothetical protein
MLSEVRRQPNEVEAPHVCVQHERPQNTFAPRLRRYIDVVVHARNDPYRDLYLRDGGVLRLRSPGASLRSG